MKKITIIILLIINIFGYSQNIRITKSDIFKDSKKHSELAFSLEDENGGLVTIRTYFGGLLRTPKGYYIQYFDSNLKLIKETDYKIDKSAIRNAFIKDGQLHLIEYQLNSKNNKITFNVLSSSVNNLDFSKKELFNFSEKDQKKYFGFLIGPVLFTNISQLDRNHGGEIIISKEKKFFAVNFDISNKDTETHKIFVFNNKFEKIYDAVIEKPIKDKFFEYNSIDIDDEDGTVYFLGKFYENNSKRIKKNGKTNYHFELVKINANGQKNTSFKNEDKFISSLILIKDKERLACIGFYGKKDESRINGTCLFNLDSSTLEMKLKKFTPFSKTFLNDKYGNKKGKKKRGLKKGIKNIDFREVHLMSNGDLIVNAEEFYVTTHTTMSQGGGMSTRTIYHFDDIISLRINTKGNLKWARNINKRQTGFSNSSFTSVTIDEDSYFFINCSDKIKKLSADRISFKQTKSKKSNLYVIKIDERGEFIFKKLIDDKESKVYYKVNNGISNIDKKSVILTGKKKKKTRILKLNI